MAKKKPITDVPIPEESKTSFKHNYFNYIAIIAAYLFLIMVMFKSKLGSDSLTKLENNYTEYESLKDSSNPAFLKMYKNGLDFMLSDYINKNTNPEKDILLLPPESYLKSFGKDFNHPMVVPLKFYYFDVKVKIVRFGAPSVDPSKATLALGFDPNGEVVPVKLTSKPILDLVIDKYKTNKPFN